MYTDKCINQPGPWIGGITLSNVLDYHGDLTHKKCQKTSQDDTELSSQRTNCHSLEWWSF